MSGSIQSENFVPDVSGWKLYFDGAFEINSCTLGSVSKAPERQMVSIEVASYSKYDLPKNAGELLAFMQTELQRVPDEYRHAAEFEEFDASYGDESFNARLFLSYSRLETEQEQADRLEKARFAGTRISIKDGLLTVAVDGVVRYRIGDLSKAETPPPFVAPDGVMLLRQAFVDDASITNAKLSPVWSVKKRVTENGQLYAAGFGAGVDPGLQFVVSSDRFVVDDRGASDTPQQISDLISNTELCRQVKTNIEQLGSSFADQVKEVIRSELHQGGLLHRSR